MSINFIVALFFVMALSFQWLSFDLLLFLIIIYATFRMTMVASDQNKSLDSFFTADGEVKSWQNGLAIAGDYISAASFLGVSAKVFQNGFDGLLYVVGFIAGWPLIMCLVAEPLKRLGKYSLADVLSTRFCPKIVRTYISMSSLSIIFFYLIAQTVGSGKLISLLLGIPYTVSIVFVGMLMTFYVFFGGMQLTTWVQMIKALLLIAGAQVLTILSLKSYGFDFNQFYLAAVEKHPMGDAILSPGLTLSSPIENLSFALALLLGTAGLPHILIRFFTVKDTKAAYESAFYATLFIGLFFSSLFVIGYATVIYVYENPAFYTDYQITGGLNMVAIHLAEALGGPFLKGIIAAVAFATIIAVVAGLTITGASILAHDIYAQLWCRGQISEQKELSASKISCIIIGFSSILLGVFFGNINPAYIVGLAFSLAASVHFPILMGTLYWPGMKVDSLKKGIIFGLVSSLGLFLLSPACWVDIFGGQQAPFPYSYSVLISLPVTVFGMFLGTLTNEEELDQKVSLNQN